MIFSHKGLEGGGGDVVWSRLMSAPFHKEAVGDATKHTQNPHAVIALDSAPIIIIGDIQTLVQAAFDAPALSVEQQPEHRWQQ
jgi:hypothetical protein